jgi:DNA polymerase delta subunit 1
MIDIILNKHDVVASVKFLQDSLHAYDLISGKFRMDDLVISKTLKAHYKDSDKIAHKALAERIKERTPGLAPQVNDRIAYVYVQTPNEKKTLQGDRIEDPKSIKEKKLKPDYTF